MDISYVVRGAARRLRNRLAAPRTQTGRNIRLIYWDTAWTGFISAGIGAFLPVFMVRLGASSFTISALTALPALVTIVVSLPASAYIERQHDHVRNTNRFRLFFRSTYLVVALLPFLLHNNLNNLPLLIVLLWCLQAIPMAFAAPAWTSVIGASIPPKRRPAVNGGRWALVSIISAIAVAGFGKLLDANLLPFPLNYQTVFFISAIAALFGMTYFAKIKMPVDYAIEPEEHLSLRVRFSNLVSPMIHTPAFIKYLAASFFIRLGIATPVALYSIFWVRNLDAGDTMIGLRTMVGQVALVIGYFLFGRLASRRGHRKVLLISAIGLACYPIVTALTPNQFWLLPAALFWGFFSGGINISFFEGLLGTTPPEKRPSFAALNAVFANLAVFVGPFLGALLMEWIGIRAAFVVAAALHLIGAILSWRLGVGQESSNMGK